MPDALQWLALEPLDTLFFRGSESMLAGEDHEVSSMFPPMPETCLGALVTAILRQRGLEPRDYTRNDGPALEIREKFPLLGSPGAPGFRLLGPLLAVNLGAVSSPWLYPAPAHWLVAPETLQEGGEVLIHPAEELLEPLQAVGVVGSVLHPVWVKNPPGDNLKSLSGYWLTGRVWENFRQGIQKARYCQDLQKADVTQPLLLPLAALMDPEVRTGIALDYGLRRVRTGHLYSATQVRLKPQVSLVLGVSPPLAPHYLDPSAVITLGGEQRRVHYTLLEHGPSLSSGESPWLMSLMPFPAGLLADYGWEEHPRVSGPFIRLAGWDMQKNFHKPCRAFFPAGTVIKVPPFEPEPPFGFIRL